MFAVFDEHGDLRADQHSDHGLYLNDCRHLSRLQLRLGTLPPLCLASNVSDDGTVLTIDLANAGDYGIGEQKPLARETVHVVRESFLWDDGLYQRLKIRNYASESQVLVLQHVFDADFSDIFEIRGARRSKRGQRLSPEVNEAEVRLRYRGADDIRRYSVIAFSPAPERLAGTAAMHRLVLEPDRDYVLHLRVLATQSRGKGRDVPAENTVGLVRAYHALRQRQRRIHRQAPRVTSSNEHFNGWLDRSIGDLHMLIADNPEGPYPHAGTPWFNTEFGRDGLLTALEALVFEPRIAAGVLNYLAAQQADTCDDFRDSEPGKILHERRHSEMAHTGEVPFGRYYGSVDSTPLFVMLAGAYWQRTADRTLIEQLWPSIRRAVQWIEEYGDVDGDGFVEYQRHADSGLVNQGWKDSGDAVSHADGSLPTGPIALCEVQGYVYAAFRAAATLAPVVGDETLAERYAARADELFTRFNDAFWDDEMASYVLALDGEKKPCQVLASNAGHCLLTGIVAPDRQQCVADALLGPALFSGWGVRTLAEGEVRYSPLSYHNGSVWPHDNAVVSLGLSVCGFRRAPVALLTALFEASLNMPAQRLPELFCGFSRKRSNSPVDYAEACAPQAWSSAAAYAFIAAALGTTVDGLDRRVRIIRPMLPEFLHYLEIRGLTVGDCSIDLRFERNAAGGTSAIPLATRGDVDIVIRP